MNRLRLLFVVESGTDVRLVEGLAEHFDLTVFARKIEGGVEVSQPLACDVPVIVGPASRPFFAHQVFVESIKRKSHTDAILVQGYSLAALAANSARQVSGTPVLMLVCSPVEAYYRARLAHPNGRPYQRHEALALDCLARANALTTPEYVVLSDHLATVVGAHGGRHVHNIPLYGVDTDIFKPPLKTKSDLKKQLGLPSTGKLIFFSSRIAPEKDSETLLRSVRHLLD